MARAAINNLRIIGGTWRGRKIAFAEAVGLRPTGDRVRETLFNWLQNDIVGSHCLDLFAGSGALGFEAASRGAKSVVMIEREATVAATLSKQLAVLQADNVAVMQMSAENFLERPTGPDPATAGSRFDIVFVDPPFDAALHRSILHLLLSSERLSAGALIYVESSKTKESSLLGEDESLTSRLTRLRSKQTGNVVYQLYQMS